MEFPEFDQFNPGRLSAAAAYSTVKGYRIAIALLAIVDDRQAEDEDDQNMGYEALLAYDMLKAAGPKEWITYARAAGYNTNGVSDDARAAAISAVAMLAGMSPELEEASPEAEMAAMDGGA
jgi:hypothetical protein